MRWADGAGLIVCAALSAGFHLLIYPPNYAPAAGSVTPIWYGAALPFLDALALCIIRVLDRIDSRSARRACHLRAVCSDQAAANALIGELNDGETARAASIRRVHPVVHAD
jgi:hypothetical protein